MTLTERVALMRRLGLACEPGDLFGRAGDETGRCRTGHSSVSYERDSDDAESERLAAAYGERCVAAERERVDRYLAGSREGGIMDRATVGNLETA
jgi:hypothetical protein